MSQITLINPLQSQAVLKLLAGRHHVANIRTYQLDAVEVPIVRLDSLAADAVQTHTHEMIMYSSKF